MLSSRSPSLQGQLDFCLIEQPVMCSSAFSPLVTQNKSRLTARLHRRLQLADMQKHRRVKSRLFHGQSGGDKNLQVSRRRETQMTSAFLCDHSSAAGNYMSAQDSDDRVGANEANAIRRTATFLILIFTSVSQLYLKLSTCDRQTLCSRSAVTDVLFVGPSSRCRGAAFI